MLVWCGSGGAERTAYGTGSPVDGSLVFSLVFLFVFFVVFWFCFICRFRFRCHIRFRFWVRFVFSFVFVFVVIFDFVFGFVFVWPSADRVSMHVRLSNVLYMPYKMHAKNGKTTLLVGTNINSYSMMKHSTVD